MMATGPRHAPCVLPGFIVYSRHYLTMDTENEDQSTSALTSATDWVRYRPTGQPGVTLMRAHFTDHTFERHSHPEFGIGLTYSGIQTFNCSGTRQTSAPGNVIFLNPDQAHDGLRGKTDSYDYSMLYVDPVVMSTLRDRAAGVLGAGYFRDAVVHAPQAAKQLHQAIKATAQAQEALRGESLLLKALMGLLLRFGEQPMAAQTPTHPGMGRLQRVREFIHAHASDDISIGELARAAGVSRVYLSRAFEHQFGVPPHVYLNAVRLANARRLLLGGMSLATVAVTAGFADQSHFSRRFKGAVGLSPGVWLRQMRGI